MHDSKKTRAHQLHEAKRKKITRVSLYLYKYNSYTNKITLHVMEHKTVAPKIDRKRQCRKITRYVPTPLSLMIEINQRLAKKLAKKESIITEKTKQINKLEMDVYSTYSCIIYPRVLCPICNVHFSINKFYKHVRLCDGYTNSYSICPRCNREFSRLDNFVRHMRTCKCKGLAGPTIDGKRQCKKCLNWFRSDNIRRHIRRCKGPVGPIIDGKRQCKKCLNWFRSDNMRRHIRRCKGPVGGPLGPIYIPIIDGKRQCPHCLLWMRSDNMRRHMRRCKGMALYTVNNINKQLLKTLADKESIITEKTTLLATLEDKVDHYNRINPTYLKEGQHDYRYTMDFLSDFRKLYNNVISV